MTNKEKFYEYLNKSKTFIGPEDSAMGELFGEARELEYSIDEQQTRINTIYNIFYYSILFKNEVIDKIEKYNMIVVPDLKGSTECQLKIICTFQQLGMFYYNFDIYVPYDELDKLANTTDEKRKNFVCNKIVEDCLKAIYRSIAENVYNKISNKFNAKYEEIFYVSGFLDRFFSIGVVINDESNFVMVKQNTDYIINHFKSFGFILSDAMLLNNNDIRIDNLNSYNFVKEFNESLTKAVYNVLKFFYPDFELEDDKTSEK